MKGQIIKFREKAVANINIANLATIKSVVEELSRSDFSNTLYIQHRVMQLSKMLIDLREQSTLTDNELIKRLQNEVTRAKMFEKEITLELQFKTKKVNLTRFIDYLTELKSLLCEIENKSSILLKEA